MVEVRGKRNFRDECVKLCWNLLLERYSRGIQGEKEKDQSRKDVSMIGVPRG